MCLLGVSRLGSTPPLLLLLFGDFSPLQLGVLEVEAGMTAYRHFRRHQFLLLDSTLYRPDRDPQAPGKFPRWDKFWLVRLFVLVALSWHVSTISSFGADSQFLTLFS